MEPNHDSSDNSDTLLSEPQRMPWWERFIYVVAALVFVATMFTSGILDANRSSWSIDMRLQWFDVESLIWLIGFPFYMASYVLIIRRRRPNLWATLPRWERAVYMVGATLASLAFLLDNLSNAISLLPLNWIEALPQIFRIPFLEIDLLLLSASFPFMGAIILFMRRWEPGKWPELRQMWGLWLLLAGTLLLAICSAWGTFMLTTPAGQSPSNSSKLLLVLFLVGIVITIFRVVASVAHRQRGR